jgi:DNA-binding FadR family transcriptional regulator
MFDLPTSSRRYLQIARSLSQQINDGTYKTGERLPPERELSVQLQASRTVVREALLALEIMHFVEIRGGAGVFVLPENLRDQSYGELAQVDEIGPWDVLEARRCIEAQTAFSAALQGTKDVLAQMESSIDRMKNAISDIPRFDAADAEFHALVARASGNSLFENYVAHLWKMRQSALWNTWYDKTRAPENRIRSVEDHIAIYQAIKRGLPDVAKTAMEAHLDVLAKRFFELNL